MTKKNTKAEVKDKRQRKIQRLKSKDKDKDKTNGQCEKFAN